MLDERRAKALIRGLIYPVQFDEQPLNAVDRVLNHVVGGKAMGAASSEYFDAIQWALSSKEVLSELLPQKHSEQAIRAYLAKIKDRLEGQASPQQGQQAPALQTT